MNKSFHEWMLTKFGSLETVCGVWVPSRYAEMLSTLVFLVVTVTATLSITTFFLWIWIKMIESAGCPV